MIKNHTCSFAHLVTWVYVTNKIIYISISTRRYSTKLEMVMAYEKGSPPTMVTWHNSRVTNKKSYVSRPPNSTRWQLIVLGHHAKSARFFYHVTICNLMANEKRYISSSTSPMDTKLERRSCLWNGTNIQKIASLLVRSSFRSWIFPPHQNGTFNLT